ncbi:MAG: sugar ABC transporter ATP-binding protein [Caldilineaceae bacterium]|nr:sugar ABC transporter ATP-binding protein [Caldilineaceae bacterium]MBP8292374.1 sugar ABC transporter ATP-binding protein [Caldilineaceae bacterium]
MPQEPALELIDISKSFPGVNALQEVTLRIQPGEVHALVGENGAGKSTLLKIMFGIEHKDAGEIRLAGQVVTPRSPSHAQHLGISLVHQELQLIPELNAAQNIFLGREVSYPGWLFVNKGRSQAEARALLAKIGMYDFNVQHPVRTLSTAQRQMVEIAKALYGNAKVIAFDEPTSSLTTVETELLFGVIRDLRAAGVGIIYVSHRLEEIMTIADRVTVLRDGRLVGSAPIAELDQRAIVRMMVGRRVLEMEESEEQHAVAAAKAAAVEPTEARHEMLRVVNLTDGKKLKPASFQLYAGEILGIAGLVGSGRTELMRALYGADPAEGEVYVAGKRAKIHQPSDAIAAGIGLLPEDRKIQGLLRELSVKLNITISSLDRMKVAGFMKTSEINAASRKYVELLNISPPQIDRLVRNLSGGNQQKVVLAKWLCAGSNVVIFDEPTRGVDVGAKAEIYGLMDDLIAQGKAIIMVSSELPEILRMSHRILVMREGAIVKELSRAEATKESIMFYATGGQ